MDDVELAKRATALCLDSEPWTLGLLLIPLAILFDALKHEWC